MTDRNNDIKARVNQNVTNRTYSSESCRLLSRTRLTVLACCSIIASFSVDASCSSSSSFYSNTIIYISVFFQEYSDTVFHLAWTIILLV